MLSWYRRYVKWPLVNIKDYVLQKGVTRNNLMDLDTYLLEHAEKHLDYYIKGVKKRKEFPSCCESLNHWIVTLNSIHLMLKLKIKKQHGEKLNPTEEKIIVIGMRNFRRYFHNLWY